VQQWLVAMLAEDLDQRLGHPGALVCRYRDPHVSGPGGTAQRVGE